MEHESRRYLIVVQLGDAGHNRLRAVIGRLQEILKEFSISPAVPVFRSLTADIFGYFLESAADAQLIKSTIMSPDPRVPGGAAKLFDSADALLIMEIGSDCVAAQRFGGAGAWLEQTSSEAKQGD